MLSSSVLYQVGYAQSHHRVSEFTVRTPSGEILAEDVPIGGGQINAQLTGRVTRTATFTATDEWFPDSASDPLSPFHAIVHIRAGLGFPDGTRELFPLFTGRVYEARRSAAGQVQFRADDVAADVIAADFEWPVNSQPGASIVAEIRRLITAGYEWAEFGDDDVTDARVPKLAWDSDRGKALDDLAAVVEGRWYALGDGRFVVRRYAYDDTSPVVTLRDGPNGTLESADTVLTADGTANAVVVLAERADNPEPIRVVARDNNALSVSRYGGPYGKRVRTVRAQTATTVADAQRVARSQLEASRSLVRQWRMSCIPDMRMEPGDLAALEWRGFRDQGIIDSITYPLSPDGRMVLTTRSRLDAATGS